MNEAKLIKIEIENMKNRHKAELRKIRRELKKARKNMKKIIGIVLLTLFLSVNIGYCADVTLTLIIPEAKVDTAKTGFLKIYPNGETMDDPEWVDPEDGSEAPQIAKYDDKSWIKEKVRRIIVRDIRRGLGMIRNEQVAQVEDTNDMVV